MTAIGVQMGESHNLQFRWLRKLPSQFLSQVILIDRFAEQDRIIAILDKFEILTNSISEGLPREINLRQKQYEYYRDLLLSFPKSNV